MLKVCKSCAGLVEGELTILLKDMSAAPDWRAVSTLGLVEGEMVQGAREGDVKALLERIEIGGRSMGLEPGRLGEVFQERLSKEIVTSVVPLHWARAWNWVARDVRMPLP